MMRRCGLSAALARYCPARANATARPRQRLLERRGQDEGGRGGADRYRWHEA